LFVQLDELYVEGLIHITELGGEYYRFDEIRQELRGERTGVRYAVGSRVRVQVSRVDLDGRRIDFRMVREGLSEPARPGTVARGRPASAKSAKDSAAKGRPVKATEEAAEGIAAELSPVQQWADLQFSDRQLRQAARHAREVAARRGAGASRKTGAASKGKPKKAKATVSVVAGRKMAAKTSRKSSKKRG